MGILKVAGKVLLIPLWFIISIIGAGVKLLVHMVAIAKKILGLGIMALLIGTVICYQEQKQTSLVFTEYPKLYLPMSASRIFPVMRRFYTV